MTPSILIIGVGNEYRSDDGIGIAVSRAIQAKDIPNVIVREERRDALSLIESWSGFDTVIAIDAVSSTESVQAGRIYRFEAHQQSIPTAFFNCSTHAFGLAEAIELARSLNQLPQNFIVYGIEGKKFDGKPGLSPEVEKAVAKVEKCVLSDLQAVGAAI